MRLLEETLGRITPIDADLADTTQARLDQLTKPQGSSSTSSITKKMT